jgi:hypothetical protein
MGKRDNMDHTTPLRRRLRDVADVEQYVRDAVDQVAPAATSRRKALEAHGVQAVMRVERALPPGVPLLPVLEQVLPNRLVALTDERPGAPMLPR